MVKLLQLREYRPFIGKWLANNLDVRNLVVIRYASVPPALHAAICPHTCKLIADWLSGLALVWACFTYEFLTS